MELSDGYPHNRALLLFHRNAALSPTGRRRLAQGNGRREGHLELGQDRSGDQSRSSGPITHPVLAYCEVFADEHEETTARCWLRASTYFTLCGNNVNRTRLPLDGLCRSAG